MSITRALFTIRINGELDSRIAKSLIGGDFVDIMVIVDSLSIVFVIPRSESVNKIIKF